MGGRTLKMERARALFEDLGFENVSSYIQSGNVFFDSEDAEADALQARIEAHLAQQVGFEIPVILRTVSEFESSLGSDPFADTPNAQAAFAVIFCQSLLPALELPERSPKGDFEIVAATARDLLVAVNGGFASSNPTAYVERKYKVKATARFYHTALKILEAARS